jgi:hypothetical protein
MQTLEYREDVFPEQPPAGPFFANLGGFLLVLMLGFARIEPGPGDPQTWCKRAASCCLRDGVQSKLIAFGSGAERGGSRLRKEKATQSWNQSSTLRPVAFRRCHASQPRMRGDIAVLRVPTTPL